jgi:hypothetical protein
VSAAELAAAADEDIELPEDFNASVTEAESAMSDMETVQRGGGGIPVAPGRCMRASHSLYLLSNEHSSIYSLFFSFSCNGDRAARRRRHSGRFR